MWRDRGVPSIMLSKMPQKPPLSRKLRVAPKSAPKPTRPITSRLYMCDAGARVPAAGLSLSDVVTVFMVNLSSH